MATARPSYVMTAILLVIAGCDMDTSIEPEVDEPFSIVEASIPDMQNAMSEGRLSAQDLVQRYLTRIALYENQLNATISVNPNAMAEAELLDRERAQGRVRGPLPCTPTARCRDGRDCWPLRGQVDGARCAVQLLRAGRDPRLRLLLLRRHVRRHLQPVHRQLHRGESRRQRKRHLQRVSSTSPPR